ncbi:MAG: hypothetical protein JWM53_1358 [bacterium]|nr:hypothetical protein [bacterium]
MKQRYVTLLRGINVGGKNMLPMKELAAIFAAAGASDVSTYIQSGNVLFTATAAVASKLAAATQKRIAARYGFQVPVVIRSADEIAAVARNNPFLDAGADFAILAVMFLADKPSPRAVGALDPQRSPPDELVVRGREIYLRCPNTFAKTKLTNAWLDSKLETTSTARNWRTVLKLDELLRS